MEPSDKSTDQSKQLCKSLGLEVRETYINTYMRNLFFCLHIGLNNILPPHEINRFCHFLGFRDRHVCHIHQTRFRGSLV